MLGLSIAWCCLQSWCTLSFVSQTGCIEAVNQRGATTGNPNLGDLPLDFAQLDLSHASTNVFRVPTPETAHSSNASLTNTLFTTVGTWF